METTPTTADQSALQPPPTARQAAITSASLTISLILFGLSTFLPLLSAIVRFVPNAPLIDGRITGHLMLFLSLWGAIIATVRKEHLSIQLFQNLKFERLRNLIQRTSWYLGLFISVALFWASLCFALLAFGPDEELFGIPLTVVAMSMPLGFLFIYLIELKQTISKGQVLWWKLFATISTFIVGAILTLPSILTLVSLGNFDSEWFNSLSDAWTSTMEWLTMPFVILILFGAFLGLPLYKVIGGISLVLFAGIGSSASIIMEESYRILSNGSILAAIPLFTLCGFLLSHAKSPQRIVGLIEKTGGRFTGKTAFVTILSMAVFTTFTGASGVTILALGSLLLGVLLKNKSYGETFSYGLITSAPGPGILLPPSLAIILYASTAQVSILDMFKAGILPGLILMLGLFGMGIYKSFRSGTKEHKAVSSSEKKGSFTDAIGELILPLLIFVLLFTGAANLVETAALSVVYVLIYLGLFRRELNINALKASLTSAAIIAGGVFIILAMSRALSYYSVDTGFPQLLVEWIRSSIASPWMFILLLNLILLLVGCIMDVYSAIYIIVPLILPLGDIFGISRLHLGIIFLSNLSLGFITPPVGLNLFLSSYRFNRPMTNLYKDILPFFLIQLILVVLISFVPWFSLAFIP